MVQNIFLENMKQKIIYYFKVQTVLKYLRPITNDIVRA